MRHRTVFSAVLTALAFTTLPLAGQDLTGTWVVSAKGRRSPQTMTLELRQDGSELTGTVTTAAGGRRGGGGGGAQTVEVTDGHADGGSFGFSIVQTFGDNSITQAFSGTIDGDAMEGSIEGGRGGARPFSGERSD